MHCWKQCAKHEKEKMDGPSAAILIGPFLAVLTVLVVVLVAFEVRKRRIRKWMDEGESLLRRVDLQIDFFIIFFRISIRFK